MRVCTRVNARASSLQARPANVLFSNFLISRDASSCSSRDIRSNRNSKYVLLNAVAP
jgi:hypothetical protein